MRCLLIYGGSNWTNYARILACLQKADATKQSGLRVGGLVPPCESKPQ